MVRGIKNIFHFFNSVLANVYFGFPARKLTVIGVTGTDGKTTTVHLIYHILKHAGKKVSMVSTVEMHVGDSDQVRVFHATTPSAWALQKLLRRAVNYGDEYFVLEVTSHGLDQQRVWGIPFAVGVLTNVTHEHLDYHNSIDQYFQTKLKLLKRSKIAIIEKRVPPGNLQGENFTKKVVTFDLKKADITPLTFPFQTPLQGDYNKLNCLAAIAVAQVLAVDDVAIRSAVKSFPGVPGRMEEVETGKGFRVIIDYAHTPNAFEQVLKTIRPSVKGRIIHVFGACGERDKSKRPLIGEIAASYDDIIILTEEDYGTENVMDITEQLKRGVIRHSSFEIRDSIFIIPDRREAIRKAVSLAEKEDLILITGIGHQRFMTRGREEVPWDEKKEVEKAIQSMNDKQ